MDSATHSSMLALFKSVPAICPLKASHANSHLHKYFRFDSPPPTLPRLEFVPVFARADRLGGAQTFDTIKLDHPSIPNSLSDLPSMLPESKIVAEEDRDLYKQHMVIVDGWRKLLIFLHPEDSTIITCTETIAPSSPSSDYCR